MMKRNYLMLLSVGVVLFTTALQAQVTVGSITPVLIGSTGNFSTNGGYTLSSSTGEPIVPTAANGNYIITQGFQQPSSNGSLALNANLVYANSSCMGADDAFANVTPVGGSAPYTYAWVNAANDTINMLPGADSLVPGTYTVIVTDAGNLSLTQTFTVADGTGICGIQPYSGLTANADGHNDLWIVDYLELYQPNSVTIFNRWGMMVWKGDNYDNVSVVWNGTAQDGTPLPDGTYFYVIEVPGGHMESWVELSH